MTLDIRDWAIHSDPFLHAYLHGDLLIHIAHLGIRTENNGSSSIPLYSCCKKAFSITNFQLGHH